MFMLRSTHDTVVRELTDGHRAQVEGLKAEIAKLRRKAQADEATIDALDKSAKKFRAERDEARAELAPLKAARDRANANLAAANARRRAGAQKERA